MRSHLVKCPLVVPLVLAAWLVGAPYVVANDFPVRVSVYAEHQGGNIVYHYELHNNGPGEVREFYIGCDCAPEDTWRLGQLQLLPAGAVGGSGVARVASIDVPRHATAQPAGWRVQLGRTPGAEDRHWLAWRMPAARPNTGVRSGQTLSGFSITVPGEDAAYLHGRYSAHVLHNGRYLQVAGPLTLLDTTAPTLSLKPLLEKSADAVATFRILTVAKDDRDPEPQVKLESVERTENPANPDERQLTVHYSATDASGNRATASTTVRLPAPMPAPPSDPARGGMVQAQLNLPRPNLLP
jgi:hypothetical protein